MARLLMAVDAGIVRNNGILRFMIEGSKILRSEGHVVDLLLDTVAADNTLPLKDWFTTVYRTAGDVDYPVELDAEGKPSIGFVQERVQRFQNGYFSTGQKYDMIITNDVHSSMALKDLHKNVCHYVHTASLVDGKNYTFLKDELIDMEHMLVMDMKCFVPTDWMRENCVPGARRLGLPLTDPEQYERKTQGRGEGVLFFGEGSFRKGADRYVSVMKTLNLPARVVASSTIDVKFDGLRDLDQRCFAPDDTAAKQDFVAGCRLMYYPALGETVSYTVLEACLSQPVVLEREHQWTQQHREWCYLTDRDGAEKMVEDLYEEGGDGRERNVRKYIDQSLQDWKELL